MVERDVLGDAARLAALAEVLPLARSVSAAFDRLAGLAAAVMDAPVGFIALLSDRTQYLVGVSGPAEAPPDRRMRIDDGYCAGTVRAGRPLYIDDAGADPDYADHPAHRTLGFAAYAGAPLLDNGQIIGTVCVTDTHPRRWRRSDQRALEALAESVVSEVALHRDVDRRQRLLDAFGHAPAAIAVTRGPAHVLDYVNDSLRAVFGEVRLGQGVRAALPRLPGEVVELMDRVLATGEVYAAEGRAVSAVWPGEALARERFFDLSCSPVDRAAGAGRRGLLVVAVEVTERVLAARELERRARHQELLARTSAALNRHLDAASELQALADAVVPDLADLSTVHVLARPVSAGTAPPLPVVTERVAVAIGPGGPPRPPVRTALRWTDPDDPICATIRDGAMSRHPIPTPSVPPWALTTGTAETFRGGLAQVVLAPVVVEGLVVAVVSFGLVAGRPTWDDDELRVLGEIARHAGRALDHALSFERARSSALVLQRSLLSDPPRVEGMQVGVRYRPAGRDEIGGDWYDAFERRPGRLAVVIGDVLGHDITAAAAMGQLRATLRSIAVDRDGGPSRALDRLATVNSRLRLTPFATLVHAHLERDDAGWSMCWASAGHPPPLLHLPGERPRFLDGAGPALTLAADADAPHPESAQALPPGATLVLYTDGLVEHPGREIDDGLAALAARTGDLAGASVERLCDALLEQAPDHDDVALLVLRAR